MTRCCLITAAAVSTYTILSTAKFCYASRIHDNPSLIKSPMTTGIMKSVFIRPFSRATKTFMDIPIPKPLRPACLHGFAKLLGINVTECEKPLSAYKSFGDFFVRLLKKNARPINKRIGGIVNPCDGIVSNLMEITGDRIPQTLIGPIKGTTFSLKGFLGYTPTSKLRLMCAIIYLAPHDYHNFHSPVKFTAYERNHFAGFVLPVNQLFARNVNDIFSSNERVVLKGKWKYGDFYYAAVGAYNVANIILTHEPEFSTNHYADELYPSTGYYDRKSYPGGDVYLRGERMGAFRLGSTIVLIFEAPSSFRWDVDIGSKVRMGELLGHVELY